MDRFLREGSWITTKNLYKDINISYVGGVLLIATLLVCYLQWHWKRRHLYIAASKVGGPFPLPFIGNALKFMGSADAFIDTIVKMEPEFGDRAALWIGHKLYFCISKAEDLKIILNSSKALEKEEVYTFTEIFMGKGLLSAEVAKWKIHRKIIAPTFNQRNLDSFVEVFAEQSEVLVKCLEQDVGKTSDISERMGKMALDSICETAMGIKMSTQTTDNAFGKTIQRIMNLVFLRMFNIWYHPNFIFKLTPYYRELGTLSKEVLDFTYKIVQDKISHHQQNLLNNSEEAKIDDKGPKRKAFLDMFIELLSDNEGNLTHQDIQDEATTLIIAGSDTTATIISFIMTCLGLYPEIQEKVYKEVVDVIGLDRSVTKEDLSKFQYTERVIKEVMRFFPVGPVITRKIAEDLEISNNIILPRGSSVGLGIYTLHFNSLHWPDPWVFDPDRFLPEVQATRHPYAYLPFSAGTRNCIGLKYAMMSLKVSVATVVRKFKIFTDYESIKDVKVRQDIVIKPLDGYKIRVELR